VRELDFRILLNVDLHLFPRSRFVPNLPAGGAYRGSIARNGLTWKVFLCGMVSSRNEEFTYARIERHNDLEIHFAL